MEQGNKTTGDFRSISVKKGAGHKVSVDNLTEYPLIGLGDQGAVFLLDRDRCVKIFASKKDVKKELKAYHTGRHSPFLPKIFESGPNYIVMEYIRGMPFDEYLRLKGFIPFEITARLVSAIKEMKLLGFRRLDVSMRHIIVTDNEAIKLIDHVNAYTINSKIPLSLFTCLTESGMLQSFMEQLKHTDIKLYNEWRREDS